MIYVLYQIPEERRLYNYSDGTQTYKKFFPYWNALEENPENNDDGYISQYYRYIGTNKKQKQILDVYNRLFSEK